MYFAWCKQKGFAPILIILLIALAIGGYLVYQKQLKSVPVTQPVPSVSPIASNLSETTAWKTYQQATAHFLIQYPQAWTAKESLDNQKPYQVILNGTEGNIIITWGSGFGGGCDAQFHQNFTLGGENEDICHFINNDGSERWAGLGKVFSDITVDLKAVANASYQTNRDTILKILSTFKFLDQNQTDNLQPFLQNISPSLGSIGTEITIYGRGFTSDNDIAFTANIEKDPGTSSHAYINKVSSADGKVIKFTLPRDFSACAFSRLGPNEACIMLAITLMKGNYEVKVVNKNGESNSLPFEIN